MKLISTLMLIALCVTPAAVLGADTTAPHSLPSLHELLGDMPKLEQTAHFVKSHKPGYQRKMTDVKLKTAGAMLIFEGRDMDHVGYVWVTLVEQVGKTTKADEMVLGIALVSVTEHTIADSKVLATYRDWKKATNAQQLHQLMSGARQTTPTKKTFRNGMTATIGQTLLSGGVLMRSYTFRLQNADSH